MPHILPCPAGPRDFADGELDGDKPRGRRKRRPKAAVSSVVERKDEDQGVSALPRMPSEVQQEMDEEGVLGTKKSNCPMPRPSLNFGELLGFRSQDRDPTSKSENDGPKKG